MKNLLHFVWLAPLAIAAAACGDDTADGTGGGSSGGGTTTSSASGTNTSAATSTGSTSSSDGGGTAEGGGGSGTGGSGTGGFVPGEPLEAPAEEWSWVDFPESRCINDTPTGIGVNLSASNDEDVVIFLMGGNACFNNLTCLITANTNGYDETKFEDEITLVEGSDLFNREESPISDWSWAYVPYCTGDVHAGDNAGVEVGGVERTFRGFRNMSDYLARLVPTFPNAKRVMLMGVSAGGLGATFNYDQVKRAFGDGVDVYLVDDSGPLMSEEYIPACLQGHFKEVWGLDNTLPAGCDACRAGETFTEEYFAYELEQFPDQRFAVISSTSDGTISSFLSFGDNECAGLNGAPGTYPAGKYEEGLIDMRDRIAANANFALFMPEDNRHVWVDDSEGLSTVVGDSPTLLDWIGQTINNDDAWQSWPAAE